MSIVSLLASGVSAGLLSGAFVILFSAPRQSMIPATAIGFLARVMCDGLTQAGASQAMATSVAAASVVVIAHAAMRIRRPDVSPVILVSGLVPLGAAKSFFEAIIGLLKAPLLRGDALSAAASALMSDVAAVFTMTLALALGVAVGALVVEVGRSLLGSDGGPLKL